ncbi:MAG: hypothetical protein K2G89_03440 [Lachnospiraceae bacterium]|nr:hypothetical protein [Lachnospiraceae bacterium]
MTDIQEKTLKQMYDEYLKTGSADWIDISTPVGKQLADLGYVTENLLGEFKLTKSGIQHMSN